MQSGGATGISFDYASNYYDADGDSAPLLIRKGDGASAGWKFLTYSDNTLQSVQESVCTGTASGVFVSLLSKVLIVKVGTDYQLCQFNTATPTAVINPKVLSVPTTGVTTISKFSAYFYTSSLVYVTITDNTSSAAYSYDTTATSPVAATLLGTFFYNFRFQIYRKSPINSIWHRSSTLLKCRQCICPRRNMDSLGYHKCNSRRKLSHSVQNERRNSRSYRP